MSEAELNGGTDPATESVRDGASDADKIVVVAAAILDRGWLLTGRRSEPSALAGGWELPGGKVELGESDEQALRREIQEELGVDIELGARIGGVWPMSERYVLHAYRALVISGTPQPLEDHGELRWLEPGRWWDVDWLIADRPVVELLEQTPRTVPSQQ